MLEAARDSGDQDERSSSISRHKYRLIDVTIEGKAYLKHSKCLDVHLYTGLRRSSHGVKQTERGDVTDLEKTWGNRDRIALATWQCGPLLSFWIYFSTPFTCQMPPAF